MPHPFQVSGGASFSSEIFLQWPPSLARTILALTLFVSFGCAPAVRPVGSGVLQTEAGPSRADAAAPLPSAVQLTPGPPAPERAPESDPVSQIRLPYGPELCGAGRPDLAHSFISFDLEGNLPPEETLLLREWLRAAWLKELAGAPVEFQPPACEGHFLCLSGPSDMAEQLLGALVRALSAPSQASFYQGRAAALKSAEEWDHRGADWKLNTNARALRMTALRSAPPGQLPQADNSARLALVSRNRGAAKAASVPFVSLEKLLSSALPRSSVTVVSPSLTARTLNDLQGQWNQRSGKTDQRPVTAPAPEAPLLLEQDAAELSYAALVFELDKNFARGPIETALTLLLIRWEKRSRGTVRVRVQPAGGLYSMPALRVEGPHEQVTSALAEISEEYDRFISAYGAPSAREWEKAEFRKPPLTQLDPRCWAERRARESSEAVELAREALRAAGTPAIVVWGTDEPKEPAE